MIQKNRCLILLLTLLLCGCYNKTSNFTNSPYHQCEEDFLDIRIVFLEQTGGASFRLDDFIPKFIPSFSIGIGYTATSMQIQMTIRNGYRNIKWTVIGEGQDKDFNWGARTEMADVPMGYRHISPYLSSLSTLVQRTIRDGFEELRKAIDEDEPWNIIIKEISDDGKINISFGLSNELKKGDILPVYSKDDLNNRDFKQVNEQDCQNTANNEYDSLAIARIVDIEDDKSTLEIILQPQGDKSVQAGDIIKSVIKNGNREDNMNNRRRRPRTFRGQGQRASVPQRRRNNREDILRTKQPLRLGFISADVGFVVRGSFYRHNIASLLRQHIIKEAEEFHFQVLIGQYNNYSRYPY